MLLNTNFKNLYRIAGIFAFLFVLDLSPALSQKMDSLPLDSIQDIPDTLLLRIEQAHAAIDQIDAVNQKGFQIAAIKKNLPGVQQNLEEIKVDLLRSNKISDAKTLLSYQVLLTDQQTLLGEWKKTLTEYNSTLQKFSGQIIKFSSDSILSASAGDSSQKKLYNTELINLKLKLQETGVETTTNLDTISNLLASVSSSFFTINELQSVITDRLRQSGKSSFGRESPYIWSAPRGTGNENLLSLLSSAWNGQNRILSYFLANSWDNRVVLILIGFTFFIWVYRNYKKASRPALSKHIQDLKLEFLSPVPILSTIIILLSLAPLFDPDSPTLYIELIQLALLASLTFFFRKHWINGEYYIWGMIVVLYLAMSFTSAVMNQGFFLRLLLIVLNLASIYFGLKFYHRIKSALLLKRFVKPVSIIYLGLNALSIVFNIFGRISIATTLSITAIIGLTQVIGLSAFVQIITEAVDLQIKITSTSKHLFARINLQRIRETLKKALTIIAVIIWTIVFTINLNISGILYKILSNIISKPRTFGSVNFTIGNLLLFVLIFYLANLAQKYIGILFGEENATFGNQTERKSSKLVLIRLLIFIVGFLLAITASGFSMDKLTVILGALGVGIGLGMQTIVNNFVSGIILIFEKPFQIGDYIEIADKKGKVKDIGIRASKLITPQGSEIIVPNGDLLSGRLVNWTLSNNFVKAEIIFKVPADSDLDYVQSVIKEEAEKAENTLQNTAPEAFYNSFAGDNVELKLEIWINSIYNEAGFKSKLLHAIYLRLKERDIKML